jgi:hypothetical protein
MECPRVSQLLIQHYLNDFGAGMDSRSAQGKEAKNSTIRERFNTYRFADHKEKVIDLLKRITRVSVETMAIVEAMRAEKRLIAP